MVHLTGCDHVLVVCVCVRVCVDNYFTHKIAIKVAYGVVPIRFAVIK